MTIPAIPGLTALAGEPTMNAIYAQMTEGFKAMTVTEEIFIAILSTMSAEDDDFKMIEEALYNIAPQTDATFESTLKLLGDAEESAPASINFYAKDFASKDVIENFIKDYNESRENEVQKIQYTDIVGVMMSSVSIIIDVISYVLIAFVSISLVVSSIMPEHSGRGRECWISDRWHHPGNRSGSPAPPPGRRNQYPDRHC